MVRARFVVNQKIEEGQDGGTVHLSAVTGGSEEAEEYFRYTPYGDLKMGTLNPKAFDAFEVGKEYYLDFVPVPEGR